MSAMSLLSQHITQARQHAARWLWGLALFCLLLTGISLCAGDSWIPPTGWLTPEAKLFVWQLRLPRTLAVLLVGATLAVAGATMQALFNNTLSEPGLLGVSGGAGVGLVAAIFIAGSAPWLMSICAIVGALVVTLLLLHFSRRHLSASRLLLAGVALGIICSALMTWSVYFSSNLDLRQLMYWMMGGFGGVGWNAGGLMLALLPILLWLITRSRVMNLLALGEISARQLGLPLALWRNILVLAIGWLVGVSVALAGAIGFIGLVIPHILRLNGLSDHRVLLPACALAGAGVLLAADIIARVALSAAELPIGVVTATLGAPIFIWLLLRNR